MKRFFFIIVSLLFTTFYLQSPAPVQAADIKGGETVTIPSTESLENVYLFGGNISSDASISGDIVTAGGNLKLQGSSTGSVNAAGGNIVISTRVGNSLRVAGGDITISGSVTHDVVVAGGSITIDKNASIGGDLIFAGGTLKVEGPVEGRILMSGGSVILASKVGGNVEGNVGTLQVKEGTEIQGNLDYTSGNKAIISDGAIIRGQEMYHPSEKKDQGEIISTLARTVLFKLIADILFTLLLIYLFPGILKRITTVAFSQKLKSGLVGFGFMFFVPLLSLFLLLIIWLGLTAWLLYFLFLILALMVGKILLGWWALKWWYGRDKKEYKLDWKTAIVGPLLIALLAFIPVIGWAAIAVIYFISLGSLFLTALTLRDVK